MALQHDSSKAYHALIVKAISHVTEVNLTRYSAKSQLKKKFSLPRLDGRFELYGLRVKEQRSNLIERKPTLRRREIAKWEEGGRMSVSHIDVSMNAPIRHQRPRHSFQNRNKTSCLYHRLHDSAPHFGMCM